MLLVALAVSLLLPISVAAQSTNAALSGTVADASGAVVPGATVSAQNTKTSVTINTVTNDSGVYSFPSLLPGTYRLIAEKQGFRKAVYTEVMLELSARINVDFALEIGQVTEAAVEISASLDTRLALGTNSVGGVISGQKVRDLPLPNRDALGLIFTQPGIVGSNISGARIGTLNISRDGVNVQDQRINVGVASTIFTSVDLIDEVRVVTSPADAEFGRGSGQVQMITRSGGNKFHGSLFEAHRNTALNANTWFNNQRGRDANGNQISPRDVLIRNQFGGRIGGPLFLPKFGEGGPALYNGKNRTFFHVLYEGQRIATRSAITTAVHTATARQGTFRFYPGVQNGNANATVPTVDLNGNPVKPSTATGDLQSVTLLTRDPNRKADATGVVQKLIGNYPLPNNFRVGDGLNTAGYTWSQPGSSNFDHLSIRLDHTINQNNQLFFSFTRETGSNLNGFLPQPFPTAQGGNSEQLDYLYSLAWTSTIRPNIVNEFRYGALRPRLRFNAPWEKGATVPSVNNQSYVVDFSSITDPIDISNDPQGRISPSYQFSDSLTWQVGRHTYKGGVEIRFVSTNGFNSFDVMPRAVIGSGGAAVQNVTTITGIGQNANAAIAILNDLSGSLANIRQAFNSPGGANPKFLAGEGKQRTWQNREFSAFFKDDFKVRRNLTLNLGARYEWYGVPFEANGKTVGLTGNSSTIFGITGSKFTDLFQPGRLTGALTQLQAVGKNSPNPDTLLYNNDWNNFAPAVGLSWSLPWFGENKTVFRAGYGWGYERQSLRLLDVLAGDQPGLRTVTTLAQTSYLDLRQVSLPLTPVGAPLATVPLTDRTQTVRVYDTNLRMPYVQNWNASLQREIFNGALLEVRYVGNKGTRLVRGFDVNEANIFENGILEAFRAVQTGGTHPLMENIFRGLNLGLGAINGTTVTAGASLRNNANTRGFFALGDVGGFAAYLNNTNNFTARGELLTRAGLPQNFILASPQWASARLTGNTANSTYHAMQVDFTKRFSQGWTLQTNYTWSKALGEEEGAGQEIVDSYRTLRNLRADKRLMSFHRTHVVRANGTYELPFGPGRKFLTNSPGFIQRFVERWQMGGLLSIFSGSPLGSGAARSSFNQFADNTPNLVGPLPKGAGVVKFDATGVIYFDGLKQVTDPAVANITTAQGLQARSTLRAITDANGNLLLVNPLPGQLGSMAPFYFEGPGAIAFDLNVVKRIKIKEELNFEFRADFIDALNHPRFGNPTTDINSTNFGRITGAGGNRIIVLNARVNF
ncbi:MAG: carboxypeptidase regulatory-like domain-containing protein [Blastocatellia bacterium]|nr:carboxypeptidase regulatory-like domain-containing protein [Blastocatellia bacterium]